MKKIIYTANIGKPFYEHLTLPRIKNYAQRVGAELKVVNKSHRTNPQQVILDIWNETSKLSDTHCAWIDLDIVIRENALDLFKYDPRSMWACVDAGSWVKRLTNFFRSREYEPQDSLAPYFNTGIVVWNDQHARDLVEVGAADPNWPPVGDQEIFAYLWREAAISVRHIPLHVCDFSGNQHKYQPICDFVHAAGKRKAQKIAFAMAEVLKYEATLKASRK